MRTHPVAILFVLVASAVAIAQEPAARLTITVQSGGEPVAGAGVTAGSASGQTDATGTVQLAVPAGVIRVVVTREGFLPASQEIVVTSAPASLEVELVPQPEVEEEIVVVASTRSGRRLEDQPTRVEVIDREEIEEKLLMTPGDIVMMLNETGGLRVQATSPAIGAASVRVQGMAGRYTRVLSDGLPLFGQQVGGLGLLQIPPMDLGRVEVIKGAASAFYGAGAMGGVVNLLSRRPGAEPVRELLFNRSSHGATDAIAFLATSGGQGWSGSVLAGGHAQSKNDRDDDGWADVAGYRRAVLRPRLVWEGGDGRSAFVTAGITLEDREGGTLDGAVLPATRTAYIEALDTRRFDIGATGQLVLRDRYVLTARAAGAWSHHHHRFGAVLERDRHDTVFGELALRGGSGASTWVAGLAYEHEAYAPRDVPRFAYRFDVPGVFGHYDLELTPAVAISAGARVDVHSEYGTFVSPRLAALFRGGPWTSRVSLGGGFVGPTPLTESTEAAGLTRLTVPEPLRAERGTTASVDLTRRLGPASVTATLFGSRIEDPIAVERTAAYVLLNRETATTNTGVELLATWRRAPFVATSSYTYVRSREGDGPDRQEAELTPRHSAGLVAMVESEDAGRAGVEVYVTGRQRLEDNPFRTRSRPYVIIGLLAERRVGRFRLFVNAENVTDVRQTRWDPLVRPGQGADGRWTVDAWAPLDGRGVNGGIRLEF